MVLANGFYLYTILRFFWKNYRAYYLNALIMPLVSKILPKRFRPLLEKEEEAHLTTEFILKSKKYRVVNKSKKVIDMVRNISDTKEKKVKKLFEVHLTRPVRFIDDGYSDGYVSPLSSEDEDFDLATFKTGDARVE